MIEVLIIAFSAWSGVWLADRLYGWLEDRRAPKPGTLKAGADTKELWPGVSGWWDSDDTAR